MGLFGKKKFCPICGEPTPRLFTTKVEDIALCKACAAKIDLPAGELDKMSLEDFQEYIDFYDRNQILREGFHETYHMNFGLFNGTFLIDTVNGLFRLREDNSAFVMEAQHLKSFRITEDGVPLFEGDKNGLKCHQSNVPERANALAPEIARFEREMQHYRDFENMERMHRMLDDDPTNDNKRTYRPRPTFSARPVNKFFVEIDLSHPYWKNYKNDRGGPSFSNEYPSIEGYLNEYEAEVGNLRALADTLMQLIAPDAPVVHMGGLMAVVGGAIPVVQAPAPTDTVEEIRKYKGLLDAGIITEEEFAAKKKQLLGI